VQPSPCIPAQGLEVGQTQVVADGGGIEEPEREFELVLALASEVVGSSGMGLS
jgi:hypothetical protein